MGLTPFPDEERVGLNEKVRIKKKNKVKINPGTSEIGVTTDASRKSHE